MAMDGVEVDDGRLDARSRVLGQWTCRLQGLIRQHRAACPDDARSDRAILLSSMDFLVARGEIRKVDDRFLLRELL
jgi:hypothetical protein